MAIFSSIFGDSEKRRTEQMARDAEKKVELILELCNVLSLAAAFCVEQIKGSINDDAEKKDRVLYIHFEFVYFFLHLANRTAFSVLGHEQRSRLQEEIGPAIVRETIECYFGHWPTDMKQKLRAEFFEKLNDAENEYAQCKGFFSPHEPFTSNTLCTRLAKNVANLAGSPENPVTITLYCTS